MEIVNEIIENEVYYYLPLSEEELKESVKLGSFKDIIKNANLLDTYETPLDEARKIISELPKKHLILKTKLNKDSMFFVTQKGKCYCRIYWYTFCDQSFCSFIIEKAKQHNTKLDFFENRLVSGENAEKLRNVCRIFIFELMKTVIQVAEASLLPIFSINAVYDKTFEFMIPKCDMVKYELFKSTLLDAIRDVIPQNIFDKFSQYL